MLEENGFFCLIYGTLVYLVLVCQYFLFSLQLEYSICDYVIHQPGWISVFLADAWQILKHSIWVFFSKHSFV